MLRDKAKGSFKDFIFGGSPNIRVSFSLVFLCLVYLYWGTGIHSDDYSFLAAVVPYDFFGTLELVFESPTYFYSAPAIFFDLLQFHFFGSLHYLFDVAKVLITFFAIYAAWVFSRQFTTDNRAIVFSFIFVLFPLHDATNYWITGSYMLITGAWIMLSHALIGRGSTTLGLILGFIGSFWSYASPPLVAGLSITYIIEKQYRKFFLFCLPQLIYVSYYVGITQIFDIGNFRTKDITHPWIVTKQFILQIITYIDVSIGPSFGLKLIGSIFSLSLQSLIIATLFAIFLIKHLDYSRKSGEMTLMLCSLSVMICALFVFSLTGSMPQLAFNLGNRVTYFGCMVLAVFSTVILTRKCIVIPCVIILSLSIFGISDHWKSWNQMQNDIIHRIKINESLRQFDGEQLFVVGNHYSRLLNVSHIEFFSTNYVTRSVFRHAFGSEPQMRIYSLGPYHTYSEGEVIDRKYGERIPAIVPMSVYDSQTDSILKISPDDLNDYISKLPLERRHWIQFLPEQSIIKKLMLRLMPRIQYIFD